MAAATGNALLERERELERLTALLDAARSGRGGVSLIEGEAGAGKTSLLGAAGEIAAAAGMPVLRARGGEYERDFPYGVVRQLFEPQLRDPARRQELLAGSAALAAPAFEPGASPAEGGAVEHGLYWLAADLAGGSPLLLAVDDAQWADVASLRTLSYLARRLADLPIALVVAVRSGEPGAREDLLDVLRGEAAGLRIEPPPLSVAATARIVARETGSSSGDRLAAACHEATGGNPFLLTELSRALDAEEIAGDEGGIECLDRVAATGVGQAIRSRLGRLGEDATAVARAVAVLEPNAWPHLVSALSELSRPAADAATALLIEARLIGDDEPPHFVHPLIRDAVIGELTMPGRAAMHARAARLLEAAGAESDTVAAQLMLAAPSGDAWAVEQLREAADAALARGGADAAVRYLRRALREPPPGNRRLEVSRALGVALLRANDPEGLEVLRTVRAAISEAPVRAELANELAGSLGLRNGNEEAAALLEDSLAEIRAGGDEGLVLHLRGWLLVQSVWGLERICEAALDGPDPPATSRQGRFVLGVIALLDALGLGSLERAGEAAEAALADRAAIHADSLGGLPPGGALTALALADRGDRTDGLFDLAIEGARQRGAMPGVGGSHGNRALVRLLDGDLLEAQVDAEISVDILRPFGLVTPLALWSAVAVRVLMARGEQRAAALLFSGLWEGSDRVPGAPGAVLLCARGELRAASGRHAEARHDYLAAAERIGWLPHANPELFPWRIGLARCEAALGNCDEARARADEVVEDARAQGGARALGIGLMAQGVAAGDVDGIELLKGAVETLAPTRARLQHAEALADHGAALRRANFRRDAREPLREALELAHRCGARPLEERARAELAATGARPRKAVFTGVESLTPSERRVARLAGGGMTNREIAQELTVTQKTVETHMRHVFQKLDISRRTELPDAL